MYLSPQLSLFSSVPQIGRKNLIYKVDEMEGKQFIKFMTGRNPYRNVGLSQEWFINLFSRLFAKDFADPRNPNLEICLWSNNSTWISFSQNSLEAFFQNVLFWCFISNFDPNFGIVVVKWFLASWLCQMINQMNGGGQDLSQLKLSLRFQFF